jgi:4'-phosphopantetheinyl transferase EntD
VATIRTIGASDERSTTQGLDLVSEAAIVAGDSAEIAAVLRSLFPPGVSVAFAVGPAEATALYPVEADSVSNAVPSRQREFALGRDCARRALAGLGLPPGPIPIDGDRAPVWPTGVVGSITHCEGFVGAAVAAGGPLRGLGFDAEPAVPLGTEIEPLICTADELRWAKAARRPPAADWPKVMFCAKEAVYKCLAGSAGLLPDFRELAVTLRPERCAFSVRLVDDARDCPPGFSRLVGRFAVTPNFVFAVALICQSLG